MVTQQPFGVARGQAVRQFTLSNANGMEIRAIEYGAIISSIAAPDRGGTSASIVLGLPSLEDYLADRRYYGAIVGRYCNRIAHARFAIDGREYPLAANDGPHHLHGGSCGFDKVVWTGTPHADRNAVVFSRTSADGEEGYPGALAVRVTYQLTAANALVIDFDAVTDRPTHVNLTQHSYFNLAGSEAGSVSDHVVTINAGHYTPLDDERIPIGTIATVDGTAFDFRRPRLLGDRHYDHNFVLDRDGAGLQPAARITSAASGRSMAMATTEPGLQFYTGRGGLCLETQHFPDSPNRPQFPSTLLRPGETYRSRTVFTFGMAAPDDVSEIAAA